MFLIFKVNDKLTKRAVNKFLLEYSTERESAHETGIFHA